jgi:hypothetical protein
MVGAAHPLVKNQMASVPDTRGTEVSLQAWGSLAFWVLKPKCPQDTVCLESSGKVSAR